MTEEDTFNRLRRIDVNKMMDIWLRSSIKGYAVTNLTVNEEIPTDIVDLFDAYGWTFLEFVRIATTTRS